MKFWLPYTRGGSGSDVSIEFLARGLRKAGHDAHAQPYDHRYQYAPWLLASVPAPPGTDAIISNSWNGFVFHRKHSVNITVERLFVLDPAYRPYRSLPQAIFHETLVRHFVRRSIATADACVAVSDYSAEAVAAHFRLDRPRTILNAVDTCYFTPASPDPRLDDRASRPFRMLFVGNFTRRKGNDIIMEVMQQLGSGFTLAFTSGRRTNTHGDLPPNMECLGTLSLDQVRDAYRHADALLFPSRLEGLPRTVMESLACGTPVIAADTSSLPEAIDHMQTGLLCPVDNVAGFVDAARRLAGDIPLWTQMAIAARQTAIKRFCLYRMAQDYISLATRLLAAKGYRSAESH